MKNQKVLVIDYGLGNIYSVVRALEVCGAENICVSDKAEDLTDADKIVLPGVGAFGNGMQGLRDRELIEPIRHFAKSGRPLMGICLGMQMLATSSEEFGYHDGLDLIPGRVLPIPHIATDGSTLKIPHIGWCQLQRAPSVDWNNSILDQTNPGSSAYLVHSFMFEPSNPSDLLSYSTYGGHKVTTVIRRGSIYGCQFHPEKSGPEGLKILKTFLKKSNNCYTET
jgi:glutamine amidotransferase